MDVMKAPHEGIIRDLGGIQIIDRSKKYRLNNMVITEPYYDQILVYNGMTQAAVGMFPEELEHCINLGDSDYSDFFFRNYFMVPEDYDELGAINKIKERVRPAVDKDYIDKADIFTILTTTGCNARCFYCYEKGIKPKTMTIETADKIIDFMDAQARKTNNHINLRWFGGEPTVNVKVIDHICEELNRRGIRFESEITSNGYLFDEELSHRAATNWHLTFAQITIDGTEKIYNRAKNYIYDEKKNGSPYQRVKNAVGNLLDNGVNGVSIRMNTDLYNSDNILKLIDEIHDMYGNRPGLDVYAYPLFTGYGINRTSESEKETVEKLNIINEKLAALGYKGSNLLGSNLRASNCMVDRGREILFAPDGSMGLCEHFVENEFFGHIDDPYNWDWDVINSFREKMEDMEICKTCAYFTECFRLNKCEDMRLCNENLKKWRNDALRLGLRCLAKNYYEANSNTVNNSCNIQCNCDENERTLEGDMNNILERLERIERLLNTK